MLVASKQLRSMLGCQSARDTPTSGGQALAVCESTKSHFLVAFAPALLGPSSIARCCEGHGRVNR